MWARAEVGEIARSIEAYRLAVGNGVKKFGFVSAVVGDHLLRFVASNLDSLELHSARGKFSHFILDTRQILVRDCALNVEIVVEALLD